MNSSNSDTKSSFKSTNVNYVRKYIIDTIQVGTCSQEKQAFEKGNYRKMNDFTEGSIWKDSNDILLYDMKKINQNWSY